MVRSPEDRLILHCAKTSLSVEESDAARSLLAGELDWAYIVDKARRHGVAPLLYSNLRALDGLKVIPPEATMSLEERYYANLVHYMEFYQELGRVLETFCRAGIKVILLKGAALAETVYPSPALRPMGDIDLLVRTHDLSRAGQGLRELGYLPTGIGRGWPGMENYHHLSQHVHKEKQVVIEVHWNLLEPSVAAQIDIDRLWQRAQALRTPHFTALMLAPEDMLLHLCLHTALQDRFHVGLRWLTDIAEMVRHYQEHLNWELFEQDAQRYDVAEPVFWVLYLTKDLLNAHVLGRDLDRFRPDPFDETFAVCLQRYVLENDVVTVSERYVELLKAKTTIQKLKVLCRSLFPPLDSMARMYLPAPSGRHTYPYYLLRPLDLARRYGRILMSSMSKSQSVASLMERELAIREWADRWRTKKVG